MRGRQRRRQRGKNHAENVKKRAKAFAAAKHKWLLLVASLGARCVVCEEDDITLLSIDHVDGIKWERRAVRYDARVSKYVQEYKSGVPLRVLCLICNGRDGRYRQLEDAPF